MICAADLNVQHWTTYYWGIAY